MSKIFTVLLIVVIAIALKNAPGAPMQTYFAERTSGEAPKDQQVFSVNEQGMVRFLGGDGITMLTGHIHRIEKQDDDKASPVVIMAHGLGYSADCGLSPFVEAFLEAGFAVFTFDYATLGASDGFSRHEVFPQRQVGDLQAAIKTVAQHGDQMGVDSSRIVLWGTSLGGGHVISAAATLHDHPSIRAVMSMVPNLGSPLESALGTVAASPGPSLLGLAQVFMAVIRCGFERLWTGQPWYIPLVGTPGSNGLMQNPGDETGYLAMTPLDGGMYGWRNAVAADSVLYLLPYRPLSHAKLNQIKVPCLIVAAQADTLCPARYAVSAAQRIPRAHLAMIPNVGHFDLYQGEGLRQVLVEMTEFLKQQME